MSSSPPQSSSSASPGDLPQRIFAVDCYPGHVVRINSYSRPRYLIDILHILAGLPELQTLLASPLGKLFSLPVRYCSLSGQLVHQMLCRQLCTPHSDALWFVYGGQPLRFSLVEFEQLTGLSCAPSPPTTDILAATTHSEGSAPYWYTLIGRNIGEATVEDIVTLLKSEPTMPAWRKFRLALVVIVEGILLCRTQPVKPSIEVVEMVKDVAFFLHYPWGRHSFKRLIRMVTIGDYIPDKAALIKKLKQSSLAVHGFPLPIQLLAFRCIPLLTKFLPHSEDLSTFLDQTVTYLSKCKSYHTSNILSVEHDASLQVLFPFQADSEFCNTSTDDPREKLLESLVLSGYKFTNTVSFGGDASLPSLYSSSKRSKKGFDLVSFILDNDSPQQIRTYCKTSTALDCVQSVDDIVTLKLQDLKVALMADITELLITSNPEDHSLQSSEGTSSTSIFAEKRCQLSLQHSKPALHSLEDVSGSASASCFSSHDSSLEHVAFHASGKGREKLCFRDSVFSSSTDSNSIFCTSKLTCVGRLQCKKKKKIREVSSARSALLDDAMRYSRCRLALPCIGAAVPSSEAKNMFGSVSTCFSNSETQLPITENRFVLVDPPPDINHNVSGIDAVDDEPPPR